MDTNSPAPSCVLRGKSRYPRVTSNVREPQKATFARLYAGGRSNFKDWILERGTENESDVVVEAMRFFVPGAMEPDTAEVLWSLTRQRLEGALDTPIWDQRISSLSLGADGEQIRIAIGEPFDGEEVLMIFESKNLLICTAGHGMYRGKPICIPKEKAVAVEFFDA